ncbi:MAG: AIPR family protein [Candidatus Sulfotelmatobacter sp.]
MSDSQLQSGLIGASKDGGVDALYMLVNGELVDAETELDPKEPNKVNVIIFQSKEGSGFSPVAIDKLFFFTDDLLCLGRKKADYHQAYRPELITLMRLFKDKYGMIVGEGPSLSVSYYYITKLDCSHNADCDTSVGVLREKVLEHFKDAVPEFYFVNATALLNQVRSRPLKEKAIKWVSQPMPTEEGEVGLVKLTDFYTFLQDDKSELAERIFDSNVRGYWKSTPVNRKIGETLRNPGAADFWMLNNGITMLAADITNDGYLQEKVVDPQIVNGLQTSRQIFRYYKTGKELPVNDRRRLLVRIIKTGNKQIRDAVIRATNSQNPMPHEVLRATDDIHWQIETLFERYGLFYDRRKGHARDEGQPIAKIVSMIEVLQAMLCVVVQRPDDARARPRDYFKKDEDYNRVFGDGVYDLNLYYKTTQLMHLADEHLDTLVLEPIHRRNLLPYVCTYATSAALKNGYTSPGELLKLDIEAYKNALPDSFGKVEKTYDRLARKHAVDGEPDYDGLAKGPRLLKTLLTELRRKFNQKKKKPK